MNTVKVSLPAHRQPMQGYDTRYRKPKIKKLQLKILCSAEHVGFWVCAEFLDVSLVHNFHRWQIL